jgi:sigma-B regulation protein RsbU (phosphoserine phosphatase)
MTDLVANLRQAWRRLSRTDALAILLVLAGVACELLNLSVGIASFIRFISVLAAIYLLFRFIGWWRTRLLWSLRNRLIVAYLFIAVVPILLIATLVALAGQILYSRLGAYLFYEDMHRRIAMLADITDHIAAAHATLPKGISEEESERVLAAQSHEVHDIELPGLDITFSNDETLLNRVAGLGKKSFAGLVVVEPDKLYVISLRAMPEPKPKEPRVVTLRLQVTSEFLTTIAPDLGTIQVNLTRKFAGGSTPGLVFDWRNVRYETTMRIIARNRFLSQAAHWFDVPVSGPSQLEAVYLDRGTDRGSIGPIFVTLNARPSRLNARIFSSLGELNDLYSVAVIVVVFILVLIEIAALVTGVVLTQRITRAVNDLYVATQYVTNQDWSHRVKVERMDQLGRLGESFNEMTRSISNLLDEQKKRQRLENEIAIASEVQNQLFPQKMPSVPGVELEALCQAARTVSGDYYDFIQLSPTHVAIALADISGKGISAALLMASLQAALRSQLLAPGSENMSTAELVTRLNTHLVRNTGDDRFATFFVAVYDSATRTLRYTNAGHLPGLLIANGSALHLEKGGMVLGVMEEYPYEEDSVAVPPNALLIQYSDGLIEPENAYGEQFGIRRLQEAAIRVQFADPRAIGRSLMIAADEWAGTPEQADDMTVVVARLR